MYAGMSFCRGSVNCHGSDGQMYHFCESSRSGEILLDQYRGGGGGGGWGLAASGRPLPGMPTVSQRHCLDLIGCPITMPEAAFPASDPFLQPAVGSADDWMIYN